MEFHDADDRDRAIPENLQQAMAQSDLVDRLGDLALKNPLGVQRKRRGAFGEKHLSFVGNHDAKGAKGKLGVATRPLCCLISCVLSGCLFCVPHGSMCL